MATPAVEPPTSEAELCARAQSIAGLSLAEIAEHLGLSVPVDLRRDKGWVGQLLEKILGADANNLAEPDFRAIGVELKTLPVNQRGLPRETTYVCTAPLTTLVNQVWETSTVYKKLHRVLWVPIEAEPAIPLGQRHIGNPLLWSPHAEQLRILQQDWEEFAELISLGQVETITAHQGTYLQIRPKAAHSRIVCTGTGKSGERIKTLPRGFYLRTLFTAEILSAYYALP